ncbi:MAG: LysR substrate-binding domain-containing protein [Pseudomonadota bacterium]
MRLEWIEDILAVHDTGSLRAAADTRFLTASAFTRRIKAVEDAIGGEIFDRRNKPVTLKPHVVELIPRLREAAASLRQIKSDLGGIETGSHITRIICQHTLSVSWTPKVAQLLAVDGAQMRIRSGTKDECVLSVLRHDSDIAIIYEDVTLGFEDNAQLFDRVPISVEQFLPIAAFRANPDLSQNISRQRFPLVAYPRSIFLGEVLERALSQRLNKDASFSIVAESGLGPAVLEFVRQGLGIGWLPHSIVEAELKAGELEELSGLLPSFELNVVAIKSKGTKSRRLSQIWSSIEKAFGSKD